MKKASQKQQLAELQHRINELEKSEGQHKETEKALRISEAKFQRLLESAPDAIVLVDVRSVIVLVNAETETIFGYDRKELIGKSIAMLIPEHCGTYIRSTWRITCPTHGYAPWVET